MRLVLVDNLIYGEHTSAAKHLQPHLGLISLAAVARRGGVDAAVYDPKRDLFAGELRLDASLYRSMAERILNLRPDVVGFTALGCNFHCVTKSARWLKRLRPDVPILLGGPHASILHKAIVSRFDVFDAVARGEAEEILLPLIERLGSAHLDEVAGITYRHAGEVRCNPPARAIEELDELPFPAYDCYPIEGCGLDAINVEAGRGCPFSCTFCSTATFFGRNYRLKSASRLVAELDHLNRTYGFTNFSLQHDLFTVNRKKILAFCEVVRERKYHWRCSARVDCVDPELLEAMANAGCNGMYFGIETGSPRMQKISRKRLDLSLVEPMLARAAELGISATASFITGYPEEEAADQAETVDMVGHVFTRARGRMAVQLHLLTPEPGTELMAQYGDRLGFDGYVTDFNFPLLEPDDATLLSENPDLFGNHHYLPTVLPRDRHIFVTAAWDGLRTLSRGALSYLLRPYGGRLSLFLDAVDSWRQAQGCPPAPIDAAFLTRYLAAVLGADHHVVSLCRFAWAVSRLRDRALKPAASEPIGPDTILTLGQRVEILADVHLPTALAALLSIESGEFAANSLAGERVALIVKRDGPGEDISTYRIDPDMLALLERLRQPKSYIFLCRELALAGETSIPELADIRELCERGILDVADRPALAMAAA
jgi:radical SAM superfamily enzyme YgiQ (UPF0313 family)